MHGEAAEVRKHGTHKRETCSKKQHKLEDELRWRRWDWCKTIRLILVILLEIVYGIQSSIRIRNLTYICVIKNLILVDFRYSYFRIKNSWILIFLNLCYVLLHLETKGNSFKSGRDLVYKALLTWCDLDFAVVQIWLPGCFLVTVKLQCKVSFVGFLVVVNSEEEQREQQSSAGLQHDPSFLSPTSSIIQNYVIICTTWENLQKFTR